MPFTHCTLSVTVKRLRRLETPAALFGPAAVIPEIPVVVVPPLTMMPPGPFPRTKPRLGENDVNGAESKMKAARENPVVKLFTTLGEKIWVSCRLATWLRKATADPNNGSDCGMIL